MTMQWSVAQVMSKRSHLIRRDVEALGHGTAFIPKYKRRWFTDGKESYIERDLIPGYVFFQTTPEMWGEVAPIEGVIRVLGADGRASRVPDAEFNRLFLGSKLGAFNEIEAPQATERRKRRRRPRPSKRARMAMRAERQL